MPAYRGHTMSRVAAFAKVWGISRSLSLMRVLAASSRRLVDSRSSPGTYLGLTATTDPRMEEDHDNSSKCRGLGLVATPQGPHRSRSHNAPHVFASLIEWETSASTSMGVDAQRTTARAASFLMAAAAFGCLFMGIALVVMAKSLSIANTQSSSRAVPLR